MKPTQTCRRFVMFLQSKMLWRVLNAIRSKLPQMRMKEKFTTTSVPKNTHTEMYDC